MATLGPNHEAPQVEATPELKKLLASLTNGHRLDILENGVVVGRLERLSPNESVDVDVHALWSSGGWLGCVEDGLPSDLSTNPKHMEGFGRD